MRRVWETPSLWETWSGGRAVRVVALAGSGSSLVLWRCSCSATPIALWQLSCVYSRASLEPGPAKMCLGPRRTLPRLSVSWRLSGGLVELGRLRESRRRRVCWTTWCFEGLWSLRRSVVGLRASTAALPSRAVRCRRPPLQAPLLRWPDDGVCSCSQNAANRLREVVV